MEKFNYPNGLNANRLELINALTDLSNAANVCDLIGDSILIDRPAVSSFRTFVSAEE